MLESQRLFHSFSAGVRERGHNYFMADAVEALRASTTHAEARVLGTDPRPYRVRIAVVGDAPTLTAHCSCRYAETGNRCKHLYATLLELCDEPDFHVPGAGPLRIEPFDDPDGWQPDAMTTLFDVSSEGSTTEFDEDWRPLLNLAALGTLAPPRSLGSTEPARPAGQETEILFVIKRLRTNASDEIAICFKRRKQRASGSWSKAARFRLDSSDLEHVGANSSDRSLLALLLGLPIHRDSQTAYFYSGGSALEAREASVIPAAFYGVILPRLAATGRLVRDARTIEADQRDFGSRPAIEPDDESRRWLPLRWSARPWRLGVALESRPDGVALCGYLERDGGRLALEDAVVLRSGLVLLDEEVAQWEPTSAYPWIELLQRDQLSVSAAERDELIAKIVGAPGSPRIDGVEQLGWTRTTVAPKPYLAVDLPDSARRRKLTLPASICFEYGIDSSEEEPQMIPFSSPRDTLAFRKDRIFVDRDRDIEARYGDEVIELGARPRTLTRSSQFERDGHLSNGALAELDIPASDFARLVGVLLERGWKVYADGVRWRRPSVPSLRVSTGIDWFEVRADVDFGDGATVELPELLSALRSGNNRVELGDGSFGVLPEKWVDQFSALAQFGSLKDGVLRFASGQATLLDALLSARESEGDGVEVDSEFTRFRRRLQDRHRVVPRSAPRGFKGELRDYQRDGLGWMHALGQLGLGGCLADDMGLGKTVQVLALLQARRVRRMPKGESRRPSIVVVPSSVVSNWKDEASRFAPKLRVIEYTGTGRGHLLDRFDDADLIITSYGTLRRDAAKLADQRFDYAILDEAQYIKNPNSQVAKSSRLLRARLRLALSGTPVENHLGELFSIFEFLNPGLLGNSPALQKLARSSNTRDEAAVEVIIKAVRPLILRRKKEAVLSDLPAKTEQTLYCDLGATQRRHYEELRQYYRDALLPQVENAGMARSKIQVLEALLRLRQAACHTGLIDPDRRSEKSAKLELLLERLDEVIEEGHKVLVFSQFTRLLAIVKDRLDERKIAYAYLDGRTRKRGERVAQFERDPACPVFLISLKAGGVGLNLTAADYVFILDPWWNPAVEAQAIDRAHRIGQHRPVFAYRLIARDTVEERILALQDRKRELTDAIVRAEGGVLRELSLEDLKGLLGS